jgi:rare lipoprotein A
VEPGPESIVNRRAYLYAVAIASASALSLPALGLASTGGAGLAGPASSSSDTTKTSAALTPTPGQGNITVTATGSGISFTTRSSALLRNQLKFSGTVAGPDAGKVIEIERYGKQTGWTWQPTTHSTVAADGSFTVVWSTNHIGQFKMRAVVESRPGIEPRSMTPRPSLTITVYRVALATMYGPGFYGQKTACGQTLRAKTLGVANRTLPCGTPVSIYYQGRTLTVPVIDRGPYANGADWDLTEATDKALGIDGTAKIGAVSVRRH